MNIEELPTYARFIFVALMKCALTAKENGLNEEQFLEFCKGCWESTFLNDKSKLNEILNTTMLNDIKEAMKTLKEE